MSAVEYRALYVRPEPNRVLTSRRLPGAVSRESAEASARAHIPSDADLLSVSRYDWGRPGDRTRITIIWRKP